MKLKEITLASLLLAAGFSVNAATPQIDFNVEAVIPDTSFYVKTVNGWDSQVQKMAWDDIAGTLRSFSQQLQMKNSGGGIKAYLASQPTLSSSSSSDNIDLKVVIAGKTLPVDSTTAVTLYNSSEASSEKTATMTVSQKDESSVKPSPGNYLASVTMMFDTEMPEL